ncbi:MAG TPA: hypothetical protein VLF59_01460 [Candidatus Saccharimonadales bacterium]|nr:hypothetical protein [Candidatus Saccharimonadales bacterium]
MTYLIVLLAVALVPVLAILLLRVNAAIAFMSLALGSVLVTYTSGDVDAIFGSLSAHGAANRYHWVDLGLLVIPFILTLLFTRKSIKGSKQAINVLPALACGMLLTLLVIPLLPVDVQKHIHHQMVWKQLDNLQTAVVLGGAALSLVFILLTHRTRHDDEGGKKHGKN